MLEEIEKRSQELLAKGIAARFIDKGEDSKEVAGLIERLREAITNYQVGEDLFVTPSPTHTAGQVSQQQEIYDRITNLAVSIFRFVPILYYADDRTFRQVFFRHLPKIARGIAIGRVFRGTG